MKKWLKQLAYRLEDKLRGLCGELTPDKRITFIILMLLVLTAGNLYFTFSTVYNWGKDSDKIKRDGSEDTRQMRPGLDNGRKPGYDFMDSASGRKLPERYMQEDGQVARQYRYKQPVNDSIIWTDNSK